MEPVTIKHYLKKLKIDGYFCHLHSPWEKGTCEHTDYLIRDMLYRITDFNELTEGDVAKMTRLLNEGQRKTLNFQTPKEAFSNWR